MSYKQKLELFTKGLELLDISEKDFFHDDAPEPNKEWGSWTDPNLEDYDESDWDAIKTVVDAIYNYEVVDIYGGEDQGSTYYIVYHFKTLDIYVKFDGWYQSYNGAEYGNCYLVTPKTKTITVYE